MNAQTKKGLIIAGIALDAAITVFLFIVSIIMLATLPKLDGDLSKAVEINGKFIGWFQENPNRFLVAGVIPLFVLLAINIVILVVYVKSTSKKKEVSLNDLSAEQREELKKKIAAELMAEANKEEK